MPGTTFIYVLNDPRTNQIRYVGKADDPLKRWKKHCKPVTTATHKSCWIESLRVLGLTPELEILEEVPYDQWEEIEREYIRVFRMIGIRLTNICDGGEGVTNVPLATRNKISAARRGQKHTESAKEKIGAAAIGNKHNVGRKASEETKQKLSLLKIGNKNALGNANLLGYRHSLEALKKISAASRDRKATEETKQKMREAWVRRKASQKGSY